MGQSPTIKEIHDLTSEGPYGARTPKQRNDRCCQAAGFRGLDVKSHQGCASKSTHALAVGSNIFSICMYNRDAYII